MKLGGGMTKPLAGGKLNQPARSELFISSSLATQAAKEGIANFECRRLSTTASCVLRNTSRGVGDPAVARACVCRNTSERNITVMSTPQRLKRVQKKSCTNSFINNSKLK